MTQATRTDSLPENRQVGDTEPTSKREAIRWLIAGGCTGAEANRLYRGWIARTVRSNDHRDFIEYVMQTIPGQHKHDIRWAA